MRSTLAEELMTSASLTHSEIAERLGMPKKVIADARTRRSGRESQLAAHLERVDKELAVLDAEKMKTVADVVKYIASKTTH